MIIERLTDDILTDSYFNDLNSKASKLLASQLFCEDNLPKLTEKELRDVLRFADILSNSKRPVARNKAYQIITLLNSTYHDNPIYRTFAHSVLAKLGNFPGIEYLKENNENNSELPFERAIEKSAKEYIQAVPDGSGLIFTDSQYELYKQISESKFFSFSGPTSMGKSFIIKAFIRKALSNSPPENIVIMVPTRALINQFSIDLNKELKDVLEHYKYKVVTNSNVAEANVEPHHYILVLTPERLISYLSQKDNPSIGYLFVDEAHKIAAEKDARAITAYNAISKALRLYSNLNLYFACPNVSNPEVFLKLFKKDESKSFKTIESPVSQNIFFIDLPNKSVTHYLGGASYQFQPTSIQAATSINDILQQLGKTNNNIVYCNSRYQAVSRAAELASLIPNTNSPIPRSVSRAIRQIKAYIHKDYYLADFLGKGIAYHFGNLPQIIRNKVENLLKSSEINFVFCTSTLLEGVNLPAKNVFILNNKNGNQIFLPIDFWNLAGRAGRLKHELSGNILCIKESATDWKKHSDLLENKKDIELNPTIENYIDKKLKKIEQILADNPDIKSEPETVKDILRYIANVISIDTLEIKRANYESPIIKKLIADNKQQIIELARKKTENVDVPSSVLSVNQSVKVAIQNKVFQELKKQVDNPVVIKLPTQIDYDTCKEWLHKLYKLFQWETEEKFKSEAQLDYYAMLANQWINGIPLSSIINQSIDYYDSKNRKIMVGFVEGKPTYENFSRLNKQHINMLIGDIIEDIEKKLRFLFEKYFNNYYLMLVALLGEENAGVNWATFLEYGTRDSVIIALQNYGLSRHSAQYLLRQHRNCLRIENDKLSGIQLDRLKRDLSREDPEFDEISAILF